MRRMKPALCALLALCLLVLPACGGTGTGDGGLAAAQEKLSGVDSLSCAVETEMNLSLAGRGFLIKSVCRVDYTSEPEAVFLQADADTGSLGTRSCTAYALSSGGVCSAYIRTSGEWARQDLSGEDALRRYDVRLASERWLAGAAEITDAGEDELDGQPARRYDLTVSAEAVDGIMEAAGAYEALSMLNVSDAAARELLSGLGEIPMSVWVGGSGLPLRYELDLTGVMSALMDAVAETLGAGYPAMTVHSLTVSLSLSSFDAVPPIEVPSEALGARPLEGGGLF